MLRPLLIRQGRSHALSAVNTGKVARSEALTRLCRGVYIRRGDWIALKIEDQHLALILAVQHSSKNSRVYSHLSAAVLHGLPLYASVQPRVHVTNPASGGGVALPHLIRHRASVATRDTVTIAGMLCTSPERTLLDLARSVSPEISLVCIDAYLRDRFRVNRHIDLQSLSVWHNEMKSRVSLFTGQRGIRTAREVLLHADPRKDSVLESVSHLRLLQLGFEVDIQVSVPGPRGYDYYVDFEFVGLGLFGECDGRTKYVDAPQLRGSTAAETLYAEKRREEWICGTTGKRVVRWGYADVSTPQTLARLLDAYGVPIPKPPAR